MFRPVKLRVNYQNMEGTDDRAHVAEGPEIGLRWAAASDAPGACQSGYRLRLA